MLPRNPRNSSSAGSGYLTDGELIPGWYAAFAALSTTTITVFRKVCANGLTVLTASKKLFVGEGSSFDRERFRAALRMTLDASVSGGRDLADRLRTSRGHNVKDPGREVRSIFRRHRLGNPRSEPARWVVAELLRGASLFGVSRFEVVQAFTAVARGLEHDTRLRWEDAMAAYLLDAKPREDDEAEAA